VKLHAFITNFINNQINSMILTLYLMTAHNVVRNHQFQISKVLHYI